MSDDIVREKAVVHRLRRPLLTPIGVLQMLSALFFSSYFFFWLFGLLALVALIKGGVLSSKGAILLVLAYFGQLILYKPHFGKGEPYARYSERLLRRRPRHSRVPGGPSRVTRRSPRVYTLRRATD